MYQPSSSSSSSMGPRNLTRYGSAPGSFLSAAADSVLGGGRPTRDFTSAAHSQQHRHHSLYYPGGADTSPPVTSESVNLPYSSESEDHTHGQGDPLDRPYGLELNTISDYKSRGGDAGGCNLIRQSSSPAGFLINQLNSPSSNASATTAAGNGFSGPRGGLGGNNSREGLVRLNSQLSLTRQDSILSHISEEEGENGDGGININNGHSRKAADSYGNASYGVCSSWPPDDPSNTFVFSPPSYKHSKNINGDAVLCLNREESQFQFGSHQSALEMATVENLLQIPGDSVPCKIRAKRGCATHPRSIAERERRTRISGKLRKLQDLVPNMDKQTSYADMLDLAVQHIKGLQNQIQKLNGELENCTCGCNQT